MKIFVHEIRNTKTNNVSYLCVDRKEDGEGYRRCMEYYNAIRDGRVIRAGSADDYEYTRSEEDIDFVWTMEQDDYELFRSRSESYGSNDYCGAVFFGNMKVEFMHIDEKNTYFNVYEYGVPGYAELDDGTPYDEHVGFADRIEFHKHLHFPDFAREIEEEIVWLLDEYHQFIGSATKFTNIDKWYPGRKAEYKPIKITRRS